jgi:EmrB/QacA subfamily drug resistance transporter
MAVQSRPGAPPIDQMPPDRMISEALVFSKREITSIISGLMLALALASLDQTIVATSLSTMARDLNGWALMPWVVSAYLITSTTTTPIYGRISDLYGRRPVLLFAIGLFVATSVLCALAQTMPQLIAARLLQGIGGGGLRSVSQAVIADIVPPRERGRYQGYFSGMFAVSSTLGPVLGGFFADYLSWHWIFWINLPLGLLAFALSNHNLKRLRRPSRKPQIDWLGAVLILAASAPILLGIGRVEQSGGWATPGVVLPIAIGLVGVVALIFRERIAPEPMLPMRLFGNPIFAVACTVSALTSIVMIGLIVLVPIDYRLVAQLSANEAGARLIPLTAGTALGAFIAGQLVSRTGRYRIFLIIGALAMTLVCGALAYLGLGHSLAADIALTAILGMSFGFQFSPMPVIVQNALDAGDTGIGLSCMMFFRLMGGALGVALLSTVLISGLGAGAIAAPGHEVLGDNPGITLLHIDEQSARLTPALLAALDATIRHAFSELFLVTAGIGFLTLIGTISLKEKTLRTRAAPRAGGEGTGKQEAP